MKMKKKIWAVAFGVTFALTVTGMESWQASWIGAGGKSVKETANQNGPDIVIKKAIYGEPGNPKKQVQLTRKFQQQIAAGSYVVQSANHVAGRDPAVNIEKELMLEYTLNGKLIKKELKENVEFNLVSGTIKSIKPVPKAHWKKAEPS